MVEAVERHDLVLPSARSAAPQSTRVNDKAAKPNIPSNSVPRVKERWALVNVAVLRNTLGGVHYSIRSGLSGIVFFRAIRCREQRCLRGRHKVAA
jgi:hypothetical protein